MAEDWRAVAAEVEDALRSVGDVSQPLGAPATLRQTTSGSGDPWDPGGSTPTYTTLRVVQTINQKRDRDGTLIGETRRTLLVGTGSGVVPTKADTIAVGVEAGQVTDATVFEAILEVRPVEPAPGFPLMYRVDLEV